MQVERACNIVVACVVLHNICARNGDDEPPENDLQAINGRRVYEDIPAPRFQQGAPAGGAATRTALINGYFARLRH